MIGTPAFDTDVRGLYESVALRFGKCPAYGTDITEDSKSRNSTGDRDVLGTVIIADMQTDSLQNRTQETLTVNTGDNRAVRLQHSRHAVGHVLLSRAGQNNQGKIEFRGQPPADFGVVLKRPALVIPPGDWGYAHQRFSGISIQHLPGPETIIVRRIEIERHTIRLYPDVTQEIEPVPGRITGSLRLFRRQVIGPLSMAETVAEPSRRSAQEGIIGAPGINQNWYIGSYCLDLATDIIESK
jgi:hypothetical protein